MDIQTLALVLANLPFVEQRESWTREKLLAYQAKSLYKLRTYVYQHSLFYQEFHRGLENAPLEALPVLSKQMLMENFDKLLTKPEIHLDEVREHMKNLKGDERYRYRYWVNATSGTSGQPGIFLFDRSEWAQVVSSYARGLKWSGLALNLWHYHKVAIIASLTPQHMSFRIGVTAQTPWVNTLSLAASEPIEVIVAALNRFQPELLVAYAHTAKILAEEQEAGQLRIAPKAILTSAEVLTAESRKKIEAVWGKILFNQYAATETGGIAAECPKHEGLHLFEDFCILEIVDANNQPVSAGVHGEKLLVTVLFKYMQPLIRYEISDSLRLIDSACSAQHPFRLIDDIQGRLQDILYFQGKNGRQVAIQPGVFHEVMDMLPSKGWQLIQTETGIRVLVQGLAEGISDAQVISSMEAAFDTQAVTRQTIEVEHVNSIPKGANNKTVLIKAFKGDVNH